MNLKELLNLKTPPKKDDLTDEDLARLFIKYNGLLKKLERDEAFWSATNENIEKAYEKLDELVEDRTIELKTVNEQLLQELTKRRRAEQILKESEVRYRELYEEAPNAYFSVGTDKLIKSCNSAAARLLGYTKEELMKMKVFDLYDNSENGLIKAKTIFQRLLKGEKIHDKELLMRHKNGEPIWISLTVKPVKDQLGQVIESRSMVISISERKKAEESIKEYSEKLEDMVDQRTSELRETQEELVRKERLAVLGKIAGGVGHELRNPLGAIKNAAYFLNMVLEEPEPEVKETLEILNKEIESSEKIISSLLGFARLKPPLMRKMDVNKILEDYLSHTAIPNNIKVIKQMDNILPSILADPDQLIQVFRNIITNAIQAMPDGGKLIVKSEASGPNCLFISFIDTGVGIPEENKKKIFEPLFTTKAKGIGLGMAVSETLIDRHGGTIEVESEEGKGTTITVKLPISGKKEV